MKRIVFLCCLFCSLFANSMRAASDTPFYLVVWTQGGPVYYAFEEQPVVNYDGAENFLVRTTKVEVQYPVADVQKFTLTEEMPTAIQQVAANDGFRFSGNAVSFTSLRPESAVRVYNPSGMLIGTVITSADGTAHLSLSELPKGIYVIKTEKFTHKIIKK